MTTTTAATLADAVQQLADVAAAVTALGIPDDVVHGLSVDRWMDGTAVHVHISGNRAEHVTYVDRIAEHYGLPADDGEGGNYRRGHSLGRSPVVVFCGRLDRDQ